jgi:hypothetical protein
VSFQNFRARRPEIGTLPLKLSPPQAPPLTQLAAAAALACQSRCRSEFNL